MDLALPSDALASFDRALSLNPNDANTLSARGYALLRLRQWREAFSSFDRATLLNNRNAPAWNGKAIALMGLNRNADSLSAAVTALSLNPRYGHALFRRGFVLDEMGRYNEALQAYREALRHYPERRSTVLHNQGITLLNLKRYQDAVESFDSAIRDDRYDDDPDWDVKSADSWYGKGFAEYQLGKFRAAAGSFRRALNLRANFPEAQEALEATRQRLGGNESSINF
jgi:tetratricopeptide (TPR) repeat protein